MAHSHTTSSNLPSTCSYCCCVDNTPHSAPTASCRSLLLSVRRPIELFFSCIFILAWILPLVLIMHGANDTVDNQLPILVRLVSTKAKAALELPINRGVFPGVSMTNWSRINGVPMATLATRRTFFALLTGHIVTSLASISTSILIRFADGSHVGIQTTGYHHLHAQFCKSRNGIYNTSMRPATLDLMYDCDVLAYNQTTNELFPVGSPAYEARFPYYERSFIFGGFYNRTYAAVQALGPGKNRSLITQEPFYAVNFDQFGKGLSALVYTFTALSSSFEIDLQQQTSSNLSSSSSSYFSDFGSPEMMNYWNKLQESYTSNPLNWNQQRFISWTLSGIDTAANRNTLLDALPQGMPDARAFVTDYKNRVAIYSHGESTTVITLNESGGVIYSDCFPDVTITKMVCLFNISDHPDYFLLKRYFDVVSSATSSSSSSVFGGSAFALEIIEDQRGIKYFANSLPLSVYLGNFTLHVFLPRDYFLEEITNASRTVIIVVVVFVFVGILVSFFVLQGLTRRITELSAKMYLHPFDSEFLRQENDHTTKKLEKNESKKDKQNDGERKSSKKENDSKNSNSKDDGNNNNNIKNKKYQTIAAVGSDFGGDEGKGMPEKTQNVVVRLWNHFLGPLFNEIEEVVLLEECFIDLRATIENLRSFMPQNVESHHVPSSKTIRRMKMMVKKRINNNNHGNQIHQVRDEAHKEHQHDERTNNKHDDDDDDDEQHKENHVEQREKRSDDDDNIADKDNNDIANYTNSGDHNNNNNNDDYSSSLESKTNTTTTAMTNPERQENAAATDEDSNKKAKNKKKAVRFTMTSPYRTTDHVLLDSGKISKKTSKKIESVDQQQQQQLSSSLNDDDDDDDASNNKVIISREQMTKRHHDRKGIYGENEHDDDDDDDTAGSEFEAPVFPQETEPSPALIVAGMGSSPELHFQAHEKNENLRNNNSNRSSSYKKKNRATKQQILNSPTQSKNNSSKDIHSQFTSPSTSSSSVEKTPSCSTSIGIEVPRCLFAVVTIVGLDQLFELERQQQRQQENTQSSGNTWKTSHSNDNDDDDGDGGYKNISNDNHNNAKNNKILLSRAEFIVASMMKVINACGAHVIEYRNDNFILYLKLSSKEGKSKLAQRFVRELVRVADEIGSNEFQQRWNVGRGRKICMTAGLAVGDAKLLVDSKASSINNNGNVISPLNQETVHHRRQKERHHGNRESDDDDDEVWANVNSVPNEVLPPPSPALTATTAAAIVEDSQLGASSPKTTTTPSKVEDTIRAKKEKLPSKSKPTKSAKTLFDLPSTTTPAILSRPLTIFSPALSEALLIEYDIRKSMHLIQYQQEQSRKHENKNKNLKKPVEKKNNSDDIGHKLGTGSHNHHQNKLSHFIGYLLTKENLETLQAPSAISGRTLLLIVSPTLPYRVLRKSGLVAHQLSEEEQLRRNRTAGITAALLLTRPTTSSRTSPASDAVHSSNGLNMLRHDGSDCSDGHGEGEEKNEAARRMELGGDGDGEKLEVTRENSASDSSSLHLSSSTASSLLVSPCGVIETIVARVIMSASALNVVNEKKHD